MYIVTVTFTVKKAFIECFKDSVLEQAQCSLKHEDHCHQFDVCHNQDKPEIFFLYEVYSHRDYFNSHTKSDHFQRFDKTVTPWLINKVVNTWKRENAKNKSNAHI